MFSIYPFLDLKINNLTFQFSPDSAIDSQLAFKKMNGIKINHSTRQLYNRHLELHDNIVI